MIKAEETYKKEHAKHALTDAKHKAMMNKCKKIAYLMNTRKCESVTQLETGCKGYGSCWEVARKNYNKNVDEVKIQEKNMKIQWRALKRIQCYLQVIDDAPKKDAKGKDIDNKEVLKACIGMKRPITDHLDIDYGKMPHEPQCPKDKMCPCTPFYITQAYKHGPKTRCAQNMVKNYKCPICKKKQWKAL